MTPFRAEVSTMSGKEITTMFLAFQEMLLGEIKQSFRSLARKYHPDKNPDNPDAESMLRRSKSICNTF